MPAYDLTAVDTIRVANNDVRAIRIANVDVFQAYSAWVETRRNLFRDPEAKTSDAGSWANAAGSSPSSTTDGDGTVWKRATRTATGALRIQDMKFGANVLAPSTSYRALLRLRCSTALTLNIFQRPTAVSSANQATIVNAGAFGVAETLVDVTFATTAATQNSADASLSIVSTSGTVGQWVEVTDVYLALAGAGPYFSGDTPDTPTKRYSFVGTVNASQSTEETRTAL